MSVEEEQLHFEKAAVLRLLCLLAPTLHSLELHLANMLDATSLFASLWMLPFPHLITLTLHGYYPFPSPPPSGSNFLHLEHLTLDGVANPHGLLAPGVLSGTFPSLATLEVRGIRCAMAFVREVSAAVADYEADSPTSRLPGTLTSIALCFAPRSGVELTRRNQMLHAQMLGVLGPMVKRPRVERRLDVQIISKCPVSEKDIRGCS